MKIIERNKCYTFDNFNINDGNKEAFKHLKKVAEKPSELCNLLVVYGAEGTGKTHLLKSVEKHLKESTKLKILYVESAQFIRDYLASKHDIDYINNELLKDWLVENTDMTFEDIFRDKYYNVDCLIIDDLQIFKTLYKVQNEFSKVLKHLIDNNKQVIISSNKNFCDLEFDNELKNQITEQGVTVDLYFNGVEGDYFGR